MVIISWFTTLFALVAEARQLERSMTARASTIAD